MAAGLFTLGQDGSSPPLSGGSGHGKMEKGTESISDGTSKAFAQGALGAHPPSTITKRGIKSRQAQMLAIGGTIGALFCLFVEEHAHSRMERCWARSSPSAWNEAGDHGIVMMISWRWGSENDADDIDNYSTRSQVLASLLERVPLWLRLGRRFSSLGILWCAY